MRAMDGSARPWGIDWLTLVQVLTCARLASVGCGGSAIDKPGTGVGGTGNIGVGGSPSGGASGTRTTSTGGLGSGGAATAGSTAGCYSPTQTATTVRPGASGGCPCNPSSDASVCVNGV